MTPTKHHFRLAYGVLALAFWLSVAGFVVLLTQHHHQEAVAWSKWRPKAQGLLGARQIAQKVSPTYMAPNGTQLAVVEEQLPIYQGTRVAAVGVRRLEPTGQISPYVGLFNTDRTLIYAFCGLGTNCSLEGASSSVQQRSVRREALELSLYAFKYLKNVDQVVSLVAAVKDGGTSAIFLRKTDLKAELDHPLRATLPHATVIDELTRQNTLPAHFESLPDGDSILVLDVAATGG